MAPQTVEQAMEWDATENTAHITYHYNLNQHTDVWKRAKKGIISASVMGSLLKKKTDKKTGEVSWSVPDTDTTRAYLYQIASERAFPEIIEDTFQSYDMMRGIRDEVDAFNLYSQKYEPLKSCGFITNTEYGVTLGYSPDGLTANHPDGLIECKSRKPKYQIETLAGDVMDDDYMVQIQLGLLVTKRKWCDFISYCGGVPMYVTRIYPDPFLHQVILEAALDADKKINQIVQSAFKTIADKKLHPTIQRLEDIQA